MLVSLRWVFWKFPFNLCISLTIQYICHYILLFSLRLIIQQGLPMFLFAPLAFYLQRRRENIAWAIRARVWGHTDQQNPKALESIRSKSSITAYWPMLVDIDIYRHQKNEHCQIKSCSVAWSFVVQQKANIKLFTFWEGDKEVAGRYSCSVQTSSLTIVLGKDLRQNVLYAPLEKQEGSANEVLGSQPVLLFMIYHHANRSVLFAFSPPWNQSGNKVKGSNCVKSTLVPLSTCVKSTLVPIKRSYFILFLLIITVRIYWVLIWNMIPFTTWWANRLGLSKLCWVNAALLSCSKQTACMSSTDADL